MRIHINMQAFVLSLVLVSFNCLPANPPNQVGTVGELLQTIKKTVYKHTPTSFKHLGHHIIAEFTGCINLNEIERLKEVLREAAVAAGATVLSVTTHQFEPFGMTGIAVLQESHISVHTWPEYGYASIDIYTCGTHVYLKKALEVLEDFFKPVKVTSVTVLRGFEPDNTNFTG